MNEFNERDLFAALAMVGFLTEKYTDAPSAKIAEWSYDMAEAMLKEKAKRDDRQEG
jgi:hypothetical protein